MKKYIAFLLVLTIIACSTNRKAENKAPVTSYKHEANTIHPLYTVFHVNDSTSELYFKVSSKDLLYTRPDGINFSSNVLISYRLMPAYESKQVDDSSSVRLIDINNDNSIKDLIGKISVKAFAAHSYFLRVTIEDKNRNTSISNMIPVEKANYVGRQNFLVKSKELDVPIFRNYVRMNEELVLDYKIKKAQTVYVRYYNRDFPLAAPPFSIGEPKPFQYKADSIYTLNVSADGKVNFSAAKNGFYHIQLDTTTHEGLTLYNFSESFPEIKKAEDLVPPLRFITSRQEYEEINLSKTPKAAIEKFWLNSTGSQDRAKEIIRKYYNRVKDANIFFTSFLEGWKTDRGMLYIIYGAPNVIYRSEYAETWVYGEEGNFNSLTFSFSKVDNPFTDNDFTLDRSTVYQQKWSEAVDIWRQGRTYLQD